jgi:uridine kinase
MLLAKAVYEIYPDCYLSIEHSLSNGIYCEIKKDCPLGQDEVKKIKSRMKEMIKEDLPIKKWKLSEKDTDNILKQEGFLEKVANINYTQKNKYTLYEIDSYYNYLYHEMVPSTGYLEKFDLYYRMPGFVLLFPQKNNPNQVPNFINQPKLANIFLEYEKMGEILGVENVSDLNEYIEKKEYNELVRIAEGLHEKKIAKIADQISENIDTKQIILIAGPSSSGKTTFTQRLSIQLKINGLRPVTISSDNYFINREDTPLDENGNYNFEALEAIDLELFNQHLLSL